MKQIALLIFAALSLLCAPYAQAGSQEVVSADDAQTAVAQGAYVMDVRPTRAFAEAHLLQAASLPADAARWPLADLAKLLSSTGIDSSRTMLIVGDAGDANAQALWQRLAAVTSGRVLWLVGGVQEWQMRGHALTTVVSSRPAIPQFLVAFDAPENASPASASPASASPASAPRMAGSRVRTSAMLERNLPVALASN